MEIQNPQTYLRETQLNRVDTPRIGIKYRCRQSCFPVSRPRAKVFNY